LFSNQGATAIPEFQEIERRFLVDGREDKPWRTDSTVFAIEQHYGVGDHLDHRPGGLFADEQLIVAVSPEEEVVLTSQSDWTTRLRKRNEGWWLTYKCRVSHDTAFELEWSLPADRAILLLGKGPYPCVEKTRYAWVGTDGAVWEIDEFEGLLAGLVLAEVELNASTAKVELPPWIGHEITGLHSWSNRALAQTLKARNRSPV
jgi:adenylate cyclase